MARFAFVVPPFAGHVNPTVATAAALQEREHEALWIGHGAAIEGLLPDGAELHDLGGALTPEQLDEIRAKAMTVRGLASLKFLWQDVLIPLARADLPAVEAALRASRADVAAVDQQAFAGALAARRLGLPWATIATTSANRAQTLGDLPQVWAWTEEQLAALQRDYGLEPSPQPELSPHLALVFSTAELAGDPAGQPPQAELVGPALGHRPARVDFPWEQLRDGPRILISLGTLNAERGRRFFEAAAEAFRDRPLQVIVVAPDELGPFPPNFLARPFVPQLELLKHVDAVVCHGGHNTVCEALAEGLPLVVLPIKDDQPVIAGQVTTAGAGLRLPFARPRPAALREAVERVLAEGSFRSAAAKVGASFAAAGGAARAAELLAGLAEVSP
jgi:MGT family glycosyltransferase